MAADKPEETMDLSGTVLEAPPGLHPDCYLFLGDPTGTTYSMFERYWMPVSAFVVFGAGSMIANATGRMPMRAGIHRHIMGAVGGCLFGEGAWRFKQKWTSEKDIQYFHYMVLHPEDFKAPERKKWSEVLQPWTPFR